ncbi:MAG: hypothetical protein E7326_02880 [Clostridiales bacterium]|nr:hypothetical protein [Clostridiales bacterium]
MKKSSFTALVLGTVSGLLFALGMCMALLPEWNMFTQGVVMGACGLVLGFVTLLIWRKMENKGPLKMNVKNLGALTVGVLGVLLLGVGMCCCMVWGKMVLGVLSGIAGIVLLLMLIPLVKGLK